MEPWEVMISESQERMVAVVAPERLAEVEAVIDRWELHRAVIGEVTETGDLRALWRRRGGRRDPGAAPHRRVPALRGRARRRAPRRRAPDRACRRRATALARAARLAALRSRAFVTAATTSSCSRAPSAAPGSTPPSSGCGPSLRGLARHARRQGRVGSLDPRRRRDARRSSRRRATSPAPAASRSASPTASTSATRRSRRSAGSSRRRSRGWRSACEALGVPIVSGQRLALQRHRRPLDPADAGRRLRRARRRRPPRARAAGARATRSCSRRLGSPLTLAGSEAQARYGTAAASRRRSTSRPRRRSSASRPRSPRARRSSTTSPRAASRSRSPRPRSGAASAPSSTSTTTRVALFGEVGGQVVVALPARPGRGRSDRRGRRRCGGSAPSAATSCSASRSPSSRAAYEGRRLMCGVFGVRSAERDVARLTYFGLFALQHRGQESAGIAVSEGGRVTALRDMGLVAAGVRRGEARGAARRGRDRPHALLDDRRRALVERAAARAPRRGAHRRARPQRQPRRTPASCATSSSPTASGSASTSDTEVIAALIAPRPGAAPRGRRAPRCSGSRARTRSSRSSDGTLVAFRDPHGIRPLTLGRIGDDWVVASETCALDLVGADGRARRPPGRGRLDRRATGCHSRAGRARRAVSAACIFEHVYFARPDSRLGGSEVHASRVRMGERLAEEAPVDADLVMPIPDSGTPAAIGFAKRVGDPVRGGADQEPLRRADVHPARPGAAPAGDQAQVQPARRDRRAAGRDRRRLDRARQHDAAARRRCSSTRARPRCTCASRRRRSSRRASTASTWPTRTSSPPRTARSRRCASTSARPRSPTSRSRACSAATRLPEERRLPRLLHAGVPDRGARRRPRQAAVRGGRPVTTARGRLRVRLKPRPPAPAAPGARGSRLQPHPRPDLRGRRRLARHGRRDRRPPPRRRRLDRDAGRRRRLRRLRRALRDRRAAPARRLDRLGRLEARARRAARGRLRWCGADLAAHCINDVLTTGAEPLFFLDYVAANTIDVGAGRGAGRGRRRRLPRRRLRDPRRRDGGAARDLPRRRARLLRHGGRRRRPRPT